MATRNNQIKEVSQLAVTIAQQATQNPSADNDPAIVQAIEQVLGLLEQKTGEGSELAKVVEAARSAIAAQADKPSS